MSTNIFLITDGKKGLKVPDEYNLVTIVSGDSTTEMSLKNYLRSGGTFTQDDIFVSQIHSTPLEARIDQIIIPPQNLVVCQKNFRFSDLEKYKTEDYDFFSGQKVETENKIVKENIYKRMEELKRLTHVFIESNFLDDEGDDSLPGKIDDWMVSFEDPLQKLFVSHVTPETSADDMTVEDEFLINPSFRKGITVYWMKVVANFMINNDIISIEEIGSIGNWEDISTWKELKEIPIKI